MRLSRAAAAAARCDRGSRSPSQIAERSERSASARHRAPGSEAGQHHPHQERSSSCWTSASPRSRPGSVTPREARRWRRRARIRSRAKAASWAPGSTWRRSSWRQGGRRSHRHLRVRRRRVRDGDGPQGVRGRQPCEPDRGDSRRESPATVGSPAGGPGGARTRRAQVSGEVAGRAVAVGARPCRCAEVDRRGAAVDQPMSAQASSERSAPSTRWPWLVAIVTAARWLLQSHGTSHAPPARQHRRRFGGSSFNRHLRPVSRTGGLRSRRMDECSSTRRGRTRSLPAVARPARRAGDSGDGTRVGSGVLP